MLEDLKRLLRQTMEARLELAHFQIRYAADAKAWDATTRALDYLDEAIDWLLIAHANAMAQEKATPPAPEVVA